MPDPAHAFAMTIDLLPAVRRGDGDALAAVYREHAPRLLRVLTGVLGSRADAEDVVHDLFLGLPEALARYEERGSFAAWLRLVGVRLGLTRLRSRRRRGEIELTPLHHPETRAAAEAIPAQLVVRTALATLPDGLRTVVALRELEGWEYPDIAATLGISVGAVMTRHCRGMRRLRAALERTR